MTLKVIFYFLELNLEFLNISIMARYIIVFLKQSLKTFEETANLCFVLGKVFLEISQNLQENIFVRVFF